MLDGRSVLGIIPARGGSKGVPRKNVRLLAGKPLLAWTIEAGTAATCIDRLILSSEDPEIIDVAREYGCEVPFVRPAGLASDDAPGMAPVMHAMDALGERFDYVVLLQPTSPLRTAEDIDAAARRCLDVPAPACVSVSLAAESPYWMFTIDDRSLLRLLVPQEKVVERRQELPDAYVLNGAVYVSEWEHVAQHGTFMTPQTVAYVMPQDRSYEIDTELDFIVVRSLMERV